MEINARKLTTVAGCTAEVFPPPSAAEMEWLRQAEKTVEENLRTSCDRLLQYASYYPPVIGLARKLIAAPPRNAWGERTDAICQVMGKQPDEGLQECIGYCATAVEGSTGWLRTIRHRMSGDPTAYPVHPGSEDYAGYREYEAEMEDVPPPIEPLPERREAHRSGSGGVAMLRDIAAMFPPPSWVIDGLLPAEGWSLGYGGTGNGKTTLFAGIEWAIATGTPWHGRSVLSGCVMHVAAEDPAGAVARLRALQARHGIEDAPVGVIPYAIDMTKPAGASALMAEAQRLQIKTHQPCRLIVLDTLAKSIGAADEDSNAEMETLCANVARVAAALGCHVAVLAHPGKDASKGPRGASCLPASADAVVRIDRGRAVVTKQRNGPDGDVFGFKLASVTIGTGPDGKAIPAAVAEPADASAKPTRRRGKAEAAEAEPEPDQVVDAEALPSTLAEAVRAADEAGAAFRLNKAGSLYERRGELPQPFSGMSRAALSMAAKAAIDAGLVASAAGVLTAPALH